MNNKKLYRPELHYEIADRKKRAKILLFFRSKGFKFPIDRNLWRDSYSDTVFLFKEITGVSYISIRLFYWSDGNSFIRCVVEKEELSFSRDYKLLPFDNYEAIYEQIETILYLMGEFQNQIDDACY
jgi:hypothetical protein